MGDLLAPVLVAAVAAFGGGWRTSLVVVSLSTILWGLAWWRWGVDPPVSEASEEEEEPSVAEALRTAIGNRKLVGWLGAVALCDLLDDMIVVFAVLHLNESVDASPQQTAAVMGAGVAGALVGLVVLDRFLSSLSSLRILWVTSALCAVAFVAWWSTSTVLGSGLWFFVVGFTAAPMYPITLARAYASLPGQSGTVNAVAHLFTPLGIGLPLGMGLVADAWGLSVALLAVLLQPIGLFSIGLSLERREARERALSSATRQPPDR